MGHALPLWKLSPFSLPSFWCEVRLTFTGDRARIPTVLTDVGTIDFSIKMNLFCPCIGLGSRVFQSISKGRDTEHATSRHTNLTIVIVTSTGMEDLNVLIDFGEDLLFEINGGGRGSRQRRGADGAREGWRGWRRGNADVQMV